MNDDDFNFNDYFCFAEELDKIKVSDNMTAIDYSDFDNYIITMRQQEADIQFKCDLFVNLYEVKLDEIGRQITAYKKFKRGKK